MGIEDEVNKRRIELENAVRRAQSEKVIIDHVKQIRVRPEWAVELAAGIAHRGLASAAILGYRQHELIKINGVTGKIPVEGREIYSAPSEDRRGWSIQMLSGYNLPSPGGSNKSGFVITEQGYILKDFTIDLRKPTRQDNEMERCHGFPVVDFKGRNWLRTHSTNIHEAIGVHEDSVYSQFDADHDAAGLRKLSEVLSAIAVSALITIETHPENVSKGRIHIHDDILSADPTIRSYQRAKLREYLY